MEEIISEPKYKKLENILMKEINNARLKKKESELFFSEREIAQKYKISRGTIRQALKSLEAKGYLVRKQGKGTFVTSPDKIHLYQMVGVFLYGHGHLYKDLYFKITRDLQKIGYYSLLSELPIFSTDVPQKETEEKSHKKVIELLKKFLNTGIENVIIDGLSFFPFQLLYKNKERIKNLFFIHQFESNIKFPQAHYILSDYSYGGYIATKHLLDLGHTHILFLTYDFSNETENFYSIQKFLNGCRKALEENGISSKSMRIYMEPEDKIENEKQLKKLLSSSQKPTAIICFGDFRAKSVFKIARELQIEIPEELSIIGYFNTPWVEVFHPSLTSVSIEEDKMVEILVDLFRSHHKERKILIKPKLIIRNSTARNERR